VVDREFLEQVKRLVIIAMFSDDDLMERLVLKGGSLLDTVLAVSKRASIDVDLSMDGEFESREYLEDKARRVLTRTFADESYCVFDIKVEEKPDKLTDDLRSFWGGYKLYFKLIKQDRYEQLKDSLQKLRQSALPIGKRESRKFTVDISKHEYCDAKEARDLAGYRIYVYPPSVLVCEKLRAICQQTEEYKVITQLHPSARARDFFDIHCVTEHYKIDFADLTFHKLVESVFAIKRVPLQLIAKIDSYREFHRLDFVSVQNTVNPGVQLHDFDFYVDYLLDKCRQLKTLWDK